MTNNLSRLASALDFVHQSISSFASASDNDFLETVTTSFGTEYNSLVLQTIFSQWQVGDFNQLPKIEVVSASILGNANGAYAQSNNKIYVSDGFLATASSSALQSLLLEEIGHYVDAQINSIDGAGDEGAIFSALVQGYKLDSETLQALKTENDQATITTGDETSILIEQQLVESTVGRKFVKDEIVIKFQDNVSKEAIQAVQQELGASISRIIPSLNIQLWKIPDGLTVERVIEQYGNDQRIQFVEPNYMENQLASGTPVSASPPLTPNDPGFVSQWALNNTGQTGGTPNADINAPEAWGALQGWGWLTAGGSAVVGVIDTGIDYTHPDLINNIWTNPGEIAGNSIDDDLNGYIDDVNGWDFFNNDNTPLDINGHGTHVSGIIAADTNNNIGIAGVTHNTTKIMPLQIFNSYNSVAIPTSDFNIAAAIAYSTDNGADLTNNSWGGIGYSNVIYSAIQAADTAGKLFVTASGNYSSNNDTTSFYPANYNLNNIISVASTDHDDQLSWFSNYGLTTVDLGAPGSNIYSTLPTNNVFSPGNMYGVVSGTSMAAPYVSGAAALILATRRSRSMIDPLFLANPNATVPQMLGFILNNGVDYILSLSGQTVTGGRLDLFKIVDQCGVGWGDVHMVTFDKRNYDFQAFGDFVFVEAKRPGDDLVVQTRQKAWISNSSVAVNTAFATLVEGHRVVYDFDFATRLQIDGNDVALSNGQTLSLGNSQISRTSNIYTIIYAGTNGVIESSDAQLQARDEGSYINLTVSRFGSVRGLLGDSDGDASNDFALRDGTQLSANPSWNEIHGKFADSWRVKADEDLFRSNQLPFVPVPPKQISLEDLDQLVVDRARKAVAAAGIPNEHIEEAAFDFAITGDESFIKGAAALFAQSTIRIEPKNGTTGDDILIGTAGNDIINGLDGNDKLRGLGGNDFLSGRAGNDILDGSSDSTGLDTFAGGAGDDIYGVYNSGTVIFEDADAGVDSVWTAVNYTLPVNVENLYLVGDVSGTGNGANNIIAGYGIGNNIIYGLGGDDTLDGGAGNDYLNGGEGNDYLIGGVGSDILDGSGDATGIDVFRGREGNDTYGVYNNADLVLEDAGEGHDSVWTTVDYTLTANVEDLYLVGNISGTGNAENNIIAGYQVGDNVIYGLGGDDTLDGGAGNDYLNGGIGNDSVIGGTGNDILDGSIDSTGLDSFTGGTGDDVYGVYNSDTIIVEDAAAGVDSVWSAVNYTLPANVEALYLVGDANGTGSNDDNTIVGYASGNNIINGLGGNDVLDAGDGNDTLNGGDGADFLRGGSSSDTFVFQFGQSSIMAADRVADFAINTDKISLFSPVGVAAPAPISFYRSNNDATSTTLMALAQAVYSDADGAVNGDQALVTGGAAIVISTDTGIAGTYLVIDDGVASFNSNDLVINITGYSGTLPTFGSTPVNAFF
jgi:subtilisin family serine protease